MPLLSHTLRLKVSIGVCLVLVALLAPMNWIQYELQRRMALRELELFAASMGTTLEHSLQEAMLRNNRDAIQSIVDGVAQSPGIQAIYLLNLDAEVAASPEKAHNGEQLDQQSNTCYVCHRLPVERRPRSVVVLNENQQPVFRTMTPIPNRPSCYRCHSAENRLNGVFYMDISMAGLETRLQQSVRTAFVGSVLIIITSALFLYFLLSWLFITPMERIAEAIRGFSQGYRTTRAPVQTHDEVGLLAQSFNDMADTIQSQDAVAAQLYAEIQTKEEVRRQLLERLTTAREEEQKRLARRIHDELGQLLTGLSLHLKLCEQALPATVEAAHTHLTKATALVQRTMEQTHVLIRLLRPTALDDYGLLPAIQEEVDRRLRPLGLQVNLAGQGDLTALPAELATAAFRIVQEALTNVIRHAAATQVWIELRADATGLAATVEDDGVGLAEGHAAQGWGILGMQERAAALGGTVEVTRREPYGVRVSLWLPRKEAAA
jgi:signal transduction histidine kinase